MSQDGPPTHESEFESETQVTLDATMRSSASPRCPDSVSAAISRGAPIGRYMVLSKLGAGAMGVVVAAYDPELDRKIALKLLTGHVGKSNARSRLQREAQALAKLDHHNVVSIYDVGTHDGRLFIAMEFVAGKTLRAWMTEVEQPRPWREVLRVFVEAGRGLAAAHEAGLVHRDFKPDNVMLGDDGRVRVMDFGLARSEDDELESDAVGAKPSVASAVDDKTSVGQLTQTGAMLGTPAYMSLEQFEGKPADARSDQFGFCVALYEALYGARPYSGKSVSELLLAVEGGRVEPAPRGVVVPSWLRTVMVRGLARNPEERWPSMQALLDALADDPVVRRRKWGAAAVVVGLLGVSGWGLVHTVERDAQTCTGFDEHLAGVWDDGQKAQVRAAIEGTGLSYAPGTWVRVEQRLDEYTRQWVAAREQACEATHHGEQSGELLDLRMACLDERLQHLRATVEVLAAPDATVVKKAVEAVASLPGLDRCADVDALMAKIPPPEDPAVARRVAALDEQLVKARALLEAGKYTDGLAIAEAVVVDAKELGYEPLLARAWLSQGELLRRTGDYEAAEATLVQAYESALGQGMVEEARAASSLLMFLVGYQLARHEDGRRWAIDAGPLARAAGTDEGLASYLTNLGAVAQKQAKYDEAREHFERALEIRLEVLGPEHPDVATSLTNLGVVAETQGAYAEARGYHERAIAVQTKVLGPEHPDIGMSLTNLGIVAKREGNYEEARSCQERAVAIKREALGPDHPDLIAPLINLGNVVRMQGDYEAARGYFEQALAICDKSLEPEHPLVAASLHNLGNVARDQQDLTQARRYNEQALALRERVLGLEHPAVADSLDDLGKIALLEGHGDEARDHYERALAIWDKALEPDHPDFVPTLLGLGRVLLAQDKPAEALAPLERALSICGSRLGDPTRLASVRFALARALWDAPSDQGRDRARAQELAELARVAYAQAGPWAKQELQEIQDWEAEHGE